MNNRPLLLAFAATCLVACKKETAEAVPPADKSVVIAPDPTLPPEIPLLPIKAGDNWCYKVRTEVGQEQVAQGKPATTETEAVRTFLGKAKPPGDHPETDTFEMVFKGNPPERELVELHDDSVFLRGSYQIIDGKPGPVTWFDKPVPFVVANVRSGTPLPSLSTAEGARTRGISVIGREPVTVPAGTYHCIRLLMTGSDGGEDGLQLRRTIWFAPGVGIVKEVTSRHTKDTLLYRQTQELAATSMKAPAAPASPAKAATGPR